MSSSSSDLLSQLWAKKEWIIGAAAAIVAINKLRTLANPKHVNIRPSSSSSSSAATESSLAVEASLFPQYFRSVSVPSIWLYHRRWEVINPRGVVFLVHGYGEHCGRYESLSSRLNSIGLSVYGFDHQGCGQSDGDRAYFERLADLVTDALAFVEFIQKGRLAELGYGQGKGQKQIPSFLLGHSMGGLVATQMMRASYTSPQQTTINDAARVNENWPARLWPWRGCVLSSPAMAANPRDATPVMIQLGEMFSVVLPKMQLTGLDLNGVSRVPSVVQQYNSDLLVWHGTMRARFGMEMFHTMKTVQAEAKNITFPMLIVQGDSDTIVHAPGNTEFYNNCTSGDKSIRIFKGGYHELFNDVCADEAIREVSSWLTLRL